ncbi:hypothetical protein ACFE04_030185 [Oxalis oulophora]
MVGFVSDPKVEENLNKPHPKSLDDPVAPFVSNNNDLFLDFDSLNEWFEDNPDPDSFSLTDIQLEDFEKSIIESMGDDNENKSVEGIFDQPAPVPDGVTSTAELTVKEEEHQLEEKLGCCIEKEMEKVSLVSTSALESNVEGALVKADKKESSESSEESESESESSSSSSSNSSSDSEDEKENEGLKKNDKNVEMKKEAVDDGEMEEGEIKSEGGDDVAVLSNQNDVDQDDIDKMVSWTDDDSDEENVKKLYGGSDAELHYSEEDDEDGVVRFNVAKNEFQNLPPVPRVDVSLEPHHQPSPVGAVLSIVGPKVIVEGAENHNPLNEGSILWITESRSPLGLIDEIFGPVKNPYYVVRYNSEDEVPASIKEGTLISFVQEFANHVLNDKNLYQKGYDGAGENGEEVSDEEFFSDDEKEAEYRKLQKMNKRSMNDQKPNNKKKNRNNRRKNRQDQFSLNQNQSQGSTSQPGNNSGPSPNNIQPGFGNGTPSFSPFPPTGPPFSAGGMYYGQPPNVVFPNGPPFQQQQNAGFPQGFPNMPNMMGPYPMPMPNMMGPFSMPFNPSQAQFPNPNFFPGGPLNFFQPPNVQWRGQGAPDQPPTNVQWRDQGAPDQSPTNVQWKGQGAPDQPPTNVQWRGQGAPDQPPTNVQWQGQGAPDQPPTNVQWRGQGAPDQPPTNVQWRGQGAPDQPPTNVQWRGQGAPEQPPTNVQWRGQGAPEQPPTNVQWRGQGAPNQVSSGMGLQQGGQPHAHVPQLHGNNKQSHPSRGRGGRFSRGRGGRGRRRQSN